VTDPEPVPFRSRSERHRSPDDRSHPARPPSWPEVARALRTARGLTQEGWAAQLGLSDVTVRRWERGAAVPTAHAETALLDWCREKNLLRPYDSGPLRGITLTPELLGDVLAAARLAARPRRAGPDAGSRPIALVPPAPDPVPDGPTPPAPGAPPILRLVPAPATSLIGRTEELACVRSFIADGGFRLVTLTGIGGAGKTRLATETARALAPHFPDGVWFVDLAPLTAPALVPQTVATVLDVRDAPGRSLTDGVTATLGDQRLLLILDNCEHVSEACAALVSSALQACPNATVLATSRQPLRVAGEQVYPVPPLAVPPPAGSLGSPWGPRDPREPAPAGREGLPTPDSRVPDAVRLFVDRGRLVRPDFALTTANAGAIAEICRRLDGLPLAIELTAARVRVLSPEQILARLGDRFRIVAGAVHGEALRHQTLAALLDWSYNLLTEPEQAMLRRLSVFRGGCTLEAVEQVCGGDSLAQEDALDLLTSLVEKSLVETDFPRGEARYRLLESVREYAAGKLAAGDEAVATRHRHADWYLAFARELEEGTEGSPHQPRRDAAPRTIEESDNLRTAFEWCLGDGQRPSTALDLVNSLGWFWPYHTLLTEGRSWYKRSLAATPDGDPEARAHALAHAGMLGFLSEDYAVGEALSRDAVAQGRRLGLPALTGRALRALALSTASLGNLPAAQEYLEEAVALTRAAGARLWLAHVLDTLGFVLVSRGNGAAARHCLEESLAIAEADDMLILLASGYMYLAMCCSLDGDTPGALSTYVKAFEAASRIGHRIGTALIISALALTVYRVGLPLHAAQLLGVWQAQSARLGINAPPRNRGHLEQGLAAIRARVGAEACDDALLAGRSMSMPEVEAFVRTIAVEAPGAPAS
jgi:predicted ATPase/DNA-binding transcriptional regulator YiaG